jgi:hypothetical protein
VIISESRHRTNIQAGRDHAADELLLDARADESLLYPSESLLGPDELLDVDTELLLHAPRDISDDSRPRSMANEYNEMLEALLTRTSSDSVGRSETNGHGEINPLTTLTEIKELLQKQARSPKDPMPPGRILSIGRVHLGWEDVILTLVLIVVLVSWF